MQNPTKGPHTLKFFETHRHFTVSYSKGLMLQWDPHWAALRDQPHRPSYNQHKQPQNFKNFQH